MSNLTLKEQLEALSLGSAPSTSAPEKNTNVKNTNVKSTKVFKKNGSQAEQVKQKPAWLEQAQYGVELLKAYFPACFREMKEMKPLKIGIKQDLVKFLSTKDDVVLSDKACMVSSLSYYVSSVAYHRNMLEGSTRIDLEGNAAGVVTAEEAQYSSECRKSKLQKNKPAPRSAAQKNETQAQ
jgi:ProP effector